ncbi:response regulator [Clostridium polynesiense]|uniref:response regulator n=1 Tax=Clostridium polynesiense TaxID=1325933 RepID=UPI000590D50E|nr:response regulator transcription factor [Clostridium polynesiense]
MNLLVVDDHPMVRKGIMSMLSVEEEKFNVYESASIGEALEAIRRQAIDLVMLDLKLGNEDGMEIITNTKNINGDVKYLILSSYISEMDFMKGEALNVQGYMLKDAFAEDIIYAVKSVMRGKKYYDPSLMRYRRESSKEALNKSLTDREKEILLEVGRGYSNSYIAHKLFLSESTVKKHVSSILNKMNFNQRSEIIYYLNSVKTGGY